MERLIQKGVRVIYDATNLLERHREQVYRMTDGNQVKLIIVKVVAPQPVATGRLQDRDEGSSDDKDVSDADLGVYRRMSRQVDPIGRNHVIVDTSQDLRPAVTKLLRLMRS
jgi:predicted kinase